MRELLVKKLIHNHGQSGLWINFSMQSLNLNH